MHKRLAEKIAERAGQGVPFKNVEEGLLWYDALPYLGLSRAAERRLLADLTVQALPPNANPSIARGLARADALAAGGRTMESLTEIGRVYEVAAQACAVKP